MHRNRWRSSGSSAHGIQGRHLSGLSLGLALLFSVSLANPLTPAERQQNEATHSCKPSPPYGVGLSAAGDSQWTLTLSNSAGSQELVVWMWAEVDATGKAVHRQQVWAGSLKADELQQISVQYAAPSSALRVWASLESPQQSDDLQAAAMRGLAVASGPAAAKTQRNKTLSVLTEDPVSGQRVEQYVGQGGLQ